ncbi:MAG TPA: hypothetical protein VGE74_12350 [Gemmata sp.]
MRLGEASDALKKLGRVYRVQVGSAFQFASADELRMLRAQIDAALGDAPKPGSATQGGSSNVA